MSRQLRVRSSWRLDDTERQHGREVLAGGPVLCELAVFDAIPVPCRALKPFPVGGMTPVERSQVRAAPIVNGDDESSASMPENRTEGEWVGWSQPERR